MKVSDILLSSGGALLILLTLIQIVPIKINPWSGLARLLGRAINKEMLENLNAVNTKVEAIDTLEKKIDSLGVEVGVLYGKFNELSSKVDSVEKKLDLSEQRSEERDIVLCRARMLRFGDEILHSAKHSKDHFDQILLDCTTYENYCYNHPGFLNNVTGQTIDLIKSTYKRCMEEKSFL